MLSSSDRDCAGACFGALASHARLVALLADPHRCDRPRYRVSAPPSLPRGRDQIVMAVAHFVKCEWTTDSRATPVQTPSTGCVRMLVFKDRRVWTRRMLVSALEQA